jgi:large subunit ribosomal protein L29
MMAQEMRQMADAALEAELETRRRDLLKVRCQVALGEEVRPHQVHELKKDIARILTVLRERKSAAAAPGGNAS